MIKILIIGANGFLGKNILQLRNEKEIQKLNFGFIGADIKRTNIASDVPFYHIDITNAVDVNEKISKISPDVIVLTAAMTDVDQCEINKKLATKINTNGPENVITACKKIHSKLIFLSTDFIFDGTKEDGPNKEDNIPNPISHYGKTKYDAEKLILSANIDYLICRTAVLYGWNKDKLNFITWILEKLRENKEISIVTNQINSPTYSKNLAEIVIQLIDDEAKGIYHTAGDGALSRYEMAIKCAEIFDYNKKLIVPINNIKQKAKRPKNAGLDINKLKKFIGDKIKIYSLEEGLKDMKLSLK